MTTSRIQNNNNSPNNNDPRLLELAAAGNIGTFLALLNTQAGSKLPAIYSDFQNPKLKEQILEYIEKQPLADRYLLYVSAMNHNTPLGKIMFMQRGLLRCTTDRGTLLKLSNLIDEHKRQLFALRDSVKSGNLTALKLWKSQYGNSEFLSALNSLTFTSQQDGFQQEELLSIALHQGHQHVANWLIENGALNLNLSSGRLTRPLIASMRQGFTETVRLLLQHGADPGLPGISESSPPLHLAIEYNQPEILSMLLARGVSPDVQNRIGLTPLILAAAVENTECLRILLASNADVNKTSYDGMTPFHYAASYGLAKNIQLLMNAGTKNINACNSLGWTPLQTAIDCSNSQAAFKIMQLLLEEGHANPNTISMHGTTPLFYATDHGRPDLVRLLLQHGAKPNMGMSGEKSPLHHAIAHHQFEIASLLLQFNADPNLKDADGNTPLMIAAKAGDLMIASLLLEKGANPDDRNIVGKNPLYLAAKHGHTNIVAELLSRGGDANTKDAHGHTALFTAARNGHLETIRKLLEYGADPKSSIILSSKKLARIIIDNPKQEQKFMHDFYVAHFNESHVSLTPSLIAKLMGHNECAKALDQHLQVRSETRKLHVMFQPVNKSIADDRIARKPGRGYSLPSLK